MADFVLVVEADIALDTAGVVVVANAEVEDETEAEAAAVIGEAAETEFPDSFPTKTPEFVVRL